MSNLLKVIDYHYFLVSSVLGASIDTYVTGGEDAYPGQFPYQVSIEYKLNPIVGEYKHVCGGAIINQNWVVTSAECITLIPSIGQIQIKAGKHELKFDSKYVQKSNVAVKLVHKDYRGSLINPIKPYNIALLKLETPLKFSDRVQPVKLPKPFLLPKGNGLLTGWGSISTGLIPVLPKVLQVANVTILTEETCEDALRVVAPISTLTDIQFCTGPLSETKTICIGDAGSPLVQLKCDTDADSQSPVLIGIASWSPYPCGKTGSPTVFTLVSAFVSWIEERIAEN
ncbi:glandular kallikrein, prostatic-like [Nasonia vitripennis]|uniref:Peptidase S1 domain-containing protein n=1 Tax=Nasonia vitripennis TaxID=7425 RepID=A0A7M7PZ87_NASVI|nr:glandular kallikrein, prostatic-like [Nasonia vitripennis]